ncbi:unnamed protein product, partial [Ascophyllum nodosum]
TSSVYRRPAAVDIPPSARLATWCTAALLGHFARNRRLRASAKPPVDRRRLVT